VDFTILQKQLLHQGVILPDKIARKYAV